MSYLLETNVVSEWIRKKPEPKVLKWLQQIPNSSLYLSVLSIGEIRKGIEMHKNKIIKEKYRIWLENDLHEWFEDRILPISHGVADQWGRLVATTKKPQPIIDSLIAATALHFDLRIVTRNHKDFSYPLLQVINPWTE